MTKAKIYHFDSYGKRQEKYDRLNHTDFDKVPWQELEIKEPYYFFVPKDFELEEEYNKGFSVSEIFGMNSNCIETGKNQVTLFFSEQDAIKMKEEILKTLKDDYLLKYNLKETRDWKFELFKKDLYNNKDKNIVNIFHRPFDLRKTFYTGTSRGFHTYSANKIMPSMLKNNLGLIFKRQSKKDFSYCFLVNSITEATFFETAYAKAQIFPLYLYQEEKENLLGQDENIAKKPNLNPEIILKIEKKLKINFVYDVNDNYDDVKGEYFSPEMLLDYIYAVLHSENYRKKYKEFLKIDFPKIPFDISKEKFFSFVNLGNKLRKLHLMEDENLKAENFITKYEISGENEVLKSDYEETDFEKGKVFINDEQYFDYVPKKVWEFYIGGYQPAQKWLKDRKGKKLDYADIIHYSKIILVLQKTIEIMQEIDNI